MQQLRRIVPLVQRFALLEPVIALQAQQFALQHQRQRLGQLCFADAGLTFEQQGPLQLEREKNRSAKPAVSEIADSLERQAQAVDVLERAH